MIKPPEIAVVVPHMGGDPHRDAAFQFVAARLARDLPECRLMAAVQSKLPIKAPRGFEAVIVDAGPVYNKPRLVNAAVARCRSNHIWIHDPDVILPFKDVLEKAPAACAVKPFSRIFRMARDETAAVISSRVIDLPPGRRTSIKDFGLASIIILRNYFNSLGGMDEAYCGRSWGGLDLACAVKERVDVPEVAVRGVHLWHPEADDGYSVLHDARYRENRGRCKYFPVTLKLRPNKTRLDVASIIARMKDKKEIVVESKAPAGPEIPVLAPKGVWRPPVPVKTPEKASGRAGRIVHVTAPALEFGGPGLRAREAFALESMVQASVNYNLHCKPGDFIVQILFTEGRCAGVTGDFKFIRPPRTSRDVGDKRGLPYLSDIVAAAWELAGEGGAVIYTNSDCAVVPDFYEKLLDRGADCVLLHRRNVYGDPATLEELFSYKNDVFEVGVDGFYMSKREWPDFDKIIRDFFVGEPHWDTSVGSFLYKHGEAVKDAGSLYHPFHQQAWSSDNLSVAGRHNLDIYLEFMDGGVIDPNLLVTLGSPKVSVVMVHYGDDPVRLAAVKESLAAMDRQCFVGEVVFVELTFKGGTSFLDLSPKFRRILLEGSLDNMGIWQKEAMMTIGAKAASHDIIVFVDTDLKAQSCDWIERIARKLALDPSRMVQGYRICADTIYPDRYRFISYGAVVSGFTGDATSNPGLVWGVHRDALVQNGWLNPYCLYGNGDSLFLAEYAGKKHPECRDWCVTQVPMMRDLVRNAPFECGLDYVDEDVHHINHGPPMSVQHYGAKNLMTLHFTKSMDKLVELDSKGLLRWIDRDCPERKMVERRGEMVDKEAVDRVCGEVLAGR